MNKITKAYKYGWIETKLSNVMENPKKRKKKVLTINVDSDVNMWNSCKLFFVSLVSIDFFINLGNSPPPFPRNIPKIKIVKSDGKWKYLPIAYTNIKIAWIKKNFTWWSIFWFYFAMINVINRDRKIIPKISILNLESALLSIIGSLEPICRIQ